MDTQVTERYMLLVTKETIGVFSLHEQILQNFANRYLP